jgi:hypothetical protein
MGLTRHARNGGGTVLALLLRCDFDSIRARRTSNMTGGLDRQCNHCADLKPLDIKAEFARDWLGQSV